MNVVLFGCSVVKTSLVESLVSRVLQARRAPWALQIGPSLLAAWLTSSLTVLAAPPIASGGGPAVVTTPSAGSDAAVAAAAPTRAVTPGVAVRAPAAGEPDMLAERERTVVREFYGWEILAAGEGGAIVSSLGLLLPERPLGTLGSVAGFLVGTPLYALGGPVAHWTHGDFTKGIVSFGANVAVPVASGFIARGVRCRDSTDDNCEYRGFFTGFALGMLVVPIADALLLGWEDVPADDQDIAVPARPSAARRARRAAPFSMAPTWNWGPRGEVQLGVAGRF